MLTCDSPFPSIAYTTRAEAQRAVVAQIDAMPKVTSNSYNDKFYRVYQCGTCGSWHWAVGDNRVPLPAPDMYVKGQVAKYYKNYRKESYSVA